jgi:hypothetical protein
MSKINNFRGHHCTGTLTLELTDDMIPVFREVFEIEMLRGETEDLPDGRTRFTLDVESEEKGAAIINFMRSIPGCREICSN